MATSEAGTALVSLDSPQMISIVSATSPTIINKGVPVIHSSEPSAVLNLN